MESDLAAIVRRRRNASKQSSFWGRSLPHFRAIEVVGTWPAGGGRTLGETRRNVCRVRANYGSAEAGTEGTGETRGDG